MSINNFIDKQIFVMDQIDKKIFVMDQITVIRKSIFFIFIKFFKLN